MSALVMPTLETARLVIRPFVIDDLDACCELLDREGGEGRSRASREHWLRWSMASYTELDALAQPPYGDRAIVHKSEGRLVGACGLASIILPMSRLLSPTLPERRTPEVGLYYALFRSEHGKGYATEAARALLDWALRELLLDRVIATTTYDNVASQRVMERLGMHIARNPHSEPHWLQIVGIKSP